MRYATTHDFCHEKGTCKNSCRWGLVKARKTIFDLLTREDIPTHFWITYEKLQLSFLCEKLICILTIFFSKIFHGDTFILPIYDQEVGNYEFLNRFAV